MCKHHPSTHISKLKAIIWFGIYSLCTPFGASHLLAPLELSTPVSNIALQHADAILVIGAGRDRNAPEYGGKDTLNALSLERVRYAATLWHNHHLPVVVSGGHPQGGTAEATIMEQVLQTEFGVPVTWVETQSTTTFEDAIDCRAILPTYIHTIILVTQAWHMPRARFAFKQAGFVVIPAATAYHLTRSTRWTDFLPHFYSVRDVGLALHEYIGLLWYQYKSLNLPQSKHINQ